MRATMERAPSWVKTPAPPPPRASPTADTPRSSRSRSRPRAGRRRSGTAPPGQVGAEGARVGLRREARVAALPVHLGPEDVHEAVARRVRGERVQRRLGLVEFAVRDQVAREEERDRGALGMAPAETPVEPGGALGIALAGIQALETLEEDDRRPPARAALPHPPRREAAAGTLEELARTHPRGHEVRVLACDREAEARRPPRLALGQRRLIAEAPQDPVLARERRRVVDAEQDLALHGERLGPAAGGCVHVAQAAREARALGVRRPRARERVGGGAEVARALRRLGEEHEEPR